MAFLCDLRLVFRGWPFLFDLRLVFRGWPFLQVAENNAGLRIYISRGGCHSDFNIFYEFNLCVYVC